MSKLSRRDFLRRVGFYAAGLAAFGPAWKVNKSSVRAQANCVRTIIETASCAVQLQKLQGDGESKAKEIRAPTRLANAFKDHRL
jgi:hypothetical protein